jgi:ABC-type sugar transport system ATPase subunit
MSETDFLVMRGIHKSFDGTRALKGVDFSARLGEVHAIVGENGAGKSTLMKILAGALRRDEGEILLDGTPVVINSPCPPAGNPGGVSGIQPGTPPEYY